MPSPRWREAWDLMWSGADAEALYAVEEAIKASRADCRSFADDYRTARQWEEPKTHHNANKWTLLHLAATNNQLQCAAALVASGGQEALRVTSHFGQTPLHLASRNGHLDMVKLLCQKGASLKATNKGGRTPLLEACQHHQHHVIHYLREAARTRKAARDELRHTKKEEASVSVSSGSAGGGAAGGSKGRE